MSSMSQKIRSDCTYRNYVEMIIVTFLFLMDIRRVFSIFFIFFVLVHIK